MKTETLHNYFLSGHGICTDTRNIAPGCLFFALKGENFNGNSFAEEALRKGAFKAIIDEGRFHENHGNTILVSDVLQCLQALSRFHRNYLKIPIIALTGSNGKTTSKELMNAVLSEKYRTVATKGNLNNHLGVPLTLLAMDQTTEIGIVEMGANHKGEIAQLCEIAAPDFGYITNFGKAHLEGFGSLAGVIEAKTELYAYLRKNGKTVFVNADDPVQLERSQGIEKIVFGKGKPSVTFLDATNKLRLKYREMEIQTQLTGAYNFSNVAAAIAIGEYFEVSPTGIKNAVEGYLPQNNRSQLLEKGSNKILLDAYNANPGSMLAALENFKQMDGKNKVLFLGDMFELGADAKKEHQIIVDFLEKNHLGKVYLIGKNFQQTRSTDPSIRKFPTFDLLKNELQNAVPENSFILIKASRGMALERVLEFL